MKSILQSNNICWVCGEKNTEIHHCIFGSGKRALSEKYGLTIHLCPKHHRLGKDAIHFNKELDNRVKRMAQEKAMEYYGWSEEDWMKIFRRNYL